MTTVMSCDRVEALLPDWLEGTLTSERAAVEAHLASCLACRTLVEDLRRIVTAAASLPVVEPERDLWPEIAARLPVRETPVVSLDERRLASVRNGATTGWRLGRWRAPLAAAAAVLVVATTLVMPRGEQPQPGPGDVAPSSPPVTDAPVVATLPDPPRPDTAVVAPTTRAARPPQAPPAPRQAPAPAPRQAAAGVTLASEPVGGSDMDVVALVSESYAREIALLAGMLRTRRDALDPNTVAVLERNLAIIDTAIQESRRALEQDPASQLLNEQLNAAFELKLEMLRRAVVLTSGT